MGRLARGVYPITLQGNPRRLWEKGLGRGCSKGLRGLKGGTGALLDVAYLTIVVNFRATLSIVSGTMGNISV